MAQPTLLKTPIAQDGAKNTIPETTGSTTGLLSQQYGWQEINALPLTAGGIAPSRLDFNGVFNLLSNILFYTQKGWQWEFDETQNYFAGCTVKDTADGKTYVCIADVSASTTHPSSDTTHWKLSDLATKGDLANYLPLAGGAMSEDTAMTRSTNTDCIYITGGNSLSNGASIQLNGVSRASNAGAFYLYSRDNGTAYTLEGKGSSLKWNGANVLTDANGGYLPLSGGRMTGNIYRSVNNDSITIMGGTSDNNAYLQLNGAEKSFGAGFFLLMSKDASNYAYLTGQPTGGLYWANNGVDCDVAGSAIVAKSLGTTGYSKRADGLIEQWGQTTAPATMSSNVPVTFPITFPNAVSSVVITSEGNMIEGNSAMSYTQVIDVTNSGFKYRSFSNSPSEIKKYWRAIGY